MSEPFLGEIRMTGWNFASRGWALCNGQLMSIAQNTALFSLLGTTYGGDGITTFGLPNLQGRMPMHWGNGAGLTPRTIGEIAGTESVTMTSSQMPAHTHAVAVATKCQNPVGDTETPGGKYWAGNSSQQNYGPTASTTMAADAVTVTINPAGG